MGLNEHFRSRGDRNRRIINRGTTDLLLEWEKIGAILMETENRLCPQLAWLPTKSQTKIKRLVLFIVSIRNT